jgi:prolyl-tRNA editing enzyme YbaK/EbsC (Cys-tRNA(Pro) deacylase)
VQRVSSFLREAGAEARIEEFPSQTPTAADAAAAVGCELQQIVKSLVFIADGRPVLALVPGDRRGDAAKIARAAGRERAKVARAEEVEQTTGFTPGAVSPFALREIDVVLMERTLFQHALVWAGAGSPNHLVGITPRELGRLSRARPADVVTDYDSNDPAKER